MARKRYKPEEIVAKLRQVDVLISQGHAMAMARSPSCYARLAGSSMTSGSSVFGDARG
jgi:hypothetical protein